MQYITYLHLEIQLYFSVLDLNARVHNCVIINFANTAKFMALSLGNMPDVGPTLATGIM